MYHNTQTLCKHLLPLDFEISADEKAYFDFIDLQIDQSKLNDQVFRDKCEELKRQQIKRSKTRNLHKEKFLGRKPQPLHFVLEIEKLVHPDDLALFYHFFNKWSRQSYGDREPTFVDFIYRQRKLVGGRRILAKSSWSRLEETGLVRKVEEYKYCQRAARYEPTELCMKLYAQSMPSSVDEYHQLEIVDPKTHISGKPITHQLENASPQVRKFALSFEKNGPFYVALDAMLTAHLERQHEVEYLFTKSGKEWTKADVKAYGRWFNNNFNLIGIRINGYERLPDGQAILYQKHGVCNSGRLSLIQGGFLNLSRDLKDIGLDECHYTQWTHDMIAAQAVALMKKAKELGIKTPKLWHYTRNKSYRHFIAQRIGHGCTPKIVKTVITSLLMGARVLSPKQVQITLSQAPKNRRINLKNCSFVETFLELGGIECYAQAHTELKDYIDEIQKVTRAIYKETRANATLKRGQRGYTNSRGMWRALWTEDYKPLENTHENQIREVLSHYLQAEEQTQVEPRTKETRATLYEHDGFTTSTPTDEKEGWTQEQRGQTSQQQQQDEPTAETLPYTYIPYKCYPVTFVGIHISLVFSKLNCLFSIFKPRLLALKYSSLCRPPPPT